MGACMIVGGNERNPLLFCLSLVSERLFCFLLGFPFAFFAGIFFGQMVWISVLHCLANRLFQEQNRVAVLQI